MNKTESIGEIISGSRDDEVALAIRAAYWAGMAQMRGQITEQVKARLESLPPSRYHRFAAAVGAYVADVYGINQGHIHRHGDSGRGEAAEILSWRYPATRSGRPYHEHADIGGAPCAE